MKYITVIKIGIHRTRGQSYMLHTTSFLGSLAGIKVWYRPKKKTKPKKNYILSRNFVFVFGHSSTHSGRLKQF